MPHIERLINFYRLFDQNSLVRIDCYTNYNQVVNVIGASKSNQYSDFQCTQQDIASYLINDKSKSNLIELQLGNINYTSRKAFEDYEFKIVHINAQYDKSDIKIINSNFPLFHYKDNSKLSIVGKYAPDAEATTKPDASFKENFNLPKQIFSEDKVIFRKKLKKITRKVDSVLKEKQRVEGLKQSKKINEIAKKLDEFIQKNKLDEKYSAVEEDLNINFYLNGDDESGENGSGDGFPPQPPGGFGILLRSCSGKADHDPIKKHIYIIFIANLGLNTVKQPFFKKLINALYVNIFFMDNDHKLLSTLSFDSLYEYYLAYQGNGIGRLIYNISGIDAFLNANNNDEERKNEDGVGANSNSTNKTITHISNYDITFIQDLNEEEKNADTPYYSYIFSICSNIRNKASDWVKGKEENVESELEVPLLDKSGENDEIKYSDGNNSSGSIAENIISWFAPKSDKSKNLNMSVALKEADLEIKGSTPTENITAKLDLSNVPEYSSSGVSTAASTPRNRGVKIEERGAPKKEGNSSYDNNILHVSKFKKLDLEKNKKFMISFTNNGECEVTTYNGRWVQEKNLNPQQGYYPCSIKKPEGYNEAHDQWLQDNNDINPYSEEISGNSMQSVEN